MKEIWKDIKGYEGLYQVSNLGRVKSTRRNKEKIMKPNKGKKGYLRLNFTINYKSKSFQVHRLVAKAFIPNPGNLPEVNHIDGNKANNNIKNLEWVTSKENCNHAWNIGLNKKIYGRKTNLKAVAQYSLNGELIKKWDYITQASKKIQIDRTGIILCCRHKQKTAGGYKWEYIKS